MDLNSIPPLPNDLAEFQNYPMLLSIAPNDVIFTQCILHFLYGLINCKYPNHPYLQSLYPFIRDDFNAQFVDHLREKYAEILSIANNDQVNAYSYSLQICYLHEMLYAFDSNSVIDLQQFTAAAQNTVLQSYPAFRMNLISIVLPQPVIITGNKMEILEGNKIPNINEGNKMPYQQQQQQQQYQQQQYQQQQYQQQIPIQNTIPDSIQPPPPPPPPPQYQQQQQHPTQNIIPDTLQPPPVINYQPQQVMLQSVNPPMPPSQLENVPAYVDSATKQMKILFRPIEDFSVFV